VDLRGYQGAAVDGLREAYVAGEPGAVLELGTGAGKTVTAMAVVAGVVRGGRSVLWLAHRQELVAQAIECARTYGLGAAIVDGSLVVCTVQGSGWRRLAQEPAVVVVDEGHRALSAGYRAVFDAYPGAFRVLLTGTAWRSDGGDLSAVAPAKVCGPTIGELTAAGFLVPAAYWSVPGVDLSGVHVRRGDFVAGEVAAAFDRPALVGDVAATFERLAGDRCGVVFCSGVAHADNVAAALRERGISAACVHGGTRKSDRAGLLASHKAGGVQVLCNADLLIEGWDHPAVSVVSVARATASAIVWRQAVGRGLRPAAGKRNCLVLDHGGNVGRLGLVSEALDYTPTAGGSARGRSAGVALLTCEACFAVLPSRPRPASCPRCFAVLPRAAREVQAQAGELVEVVGAVARRPAVDWSAWHKIDRERQMRGFRPGWTWAKYNAAKELQAWKA